MKTLKTLLISSVAIVGFATSAMARPSLSEDARITNELTVAAVADEIRTECTKISARMVVAIPKAMALRDYAMKLGYSSDEIQDFLENKAEQERIYGLRDQYLSANGVVKGDEASYCKLGESEIKKGSLLGSILKMK